MENARIRLLFTSWVVSENERDLYKTCKSQFNVLTQQNSAKCWITQRELERTFTKLNQENSLPKPRKDLQCLSHYLNQNSLQSLGVKTAEGLFNLAGGILVISLRVPLLFEETLWQQGRLVRFLYSVLVFLFCNINDSVEPLKAQTNLERVSAMSPVFTTRIKMAIHIVHKWVFVVRAWDWTNDVFSLVSFHRSPFLLADAFYVSFVRNRFFVRKSQYLWYKAAYSDRRNFPKLNIQQYICLIFSNFHQTKLQKFSPVRLLNLYS